IGAFLEAQLQMLSYASSCVHAGLDSLPTRRSSDLVGERVELRVDLGERAEVRVPGVGGRCRRGGQARALVVDRELHVGHEHVVRSEEHTSELQSREKIVCRLLLEKKSILRNGTVVE